MWTDPRILAWWALLVTLTPFLLALKVRKYLQQARPWEFDPARWRVDDLTPERTKDLRERPGPHVVFIGGGFGEMMMVERVAEALRQARPDARISYCLRDPVTIDFLRQERPAQNLAIWPFDALPAVSRWLRSQRPDVVVFTERFRFVTILTASARYGAQVALMNGRCRFREGLAYRLFAPFYRWQFRSFSAMGMQREDYYRAAPRFADPSCDIRLTGDIKTDLREPSLSPERKASLEAWLAGEIPLIAAGSTETPDEERMVIQAFKKARDVAPCRLLLAPRRPSYLEGTLALLQEEGLSFSRRTDTDTDRIESDPLTEVMLLDTLGELSTAYAACAAAYVGGSFCTGKGGHNVMEPLFSGVPVAYGMGRGHFEALQRLCEQHGVSTRIADSDDLAAFFVRFLTDAPERARIGAAGRRVIEAGRGAVSRTVEMLIPLLGR